MTHRKVRPGEKLAIPARTFNAFIDAANAVQQFGIDALGGKVGPRGPSVEVLVKNPTATAWQAFKAITLAGLVIVPDSSSATPDLLDAMTINGLLPENGESEGKWGITREVIAPGAIGRVQIAGLAAARVFIPDVSYDVSWVDIDDELTNVSQLKAQYRGSARLVWRQPSETLNTDLWALFLINASAPFSTFGVELQQTGGVDGDATTAATWTYSVRDPITTAPILTGVNITASPHKVARPDVGSIRPATFGIARNVPGGGIEVIDANEIPEAEACS